MDTQEEYKQLALRFVNEVFNEQRLGAPDDLCTNDLLGRSPVLVAHSLAGFKKTLVEMQSALSHQEMLVDYAVSEGNKVAVRMMLRARHAGSFYGLPATGRKFAVPAIMVVTIREQRICEFELVFDTRVISDQLGADLPRTQTL
jgi:predicted ester cyclase